MTKRIEDVRAHLAAQRPARSPTSPRPAGLDARPRMRGLVGASLLFACACIAGAGAWAAL
ncbi:MAG: hypothetical protein MI723_06355 [Caulobacterales bacterium]|nr:hypothetical protein [Caulobacterales bacterium]